MSVCTFFGHSECYGLDKDVLRNAIEDLIKQGTTGYQFWYWKIVTVCC